MVRTSDRRRAGALAGLLTVALVAGAGSPAHAAGRDLSADEHADVRQALKAVVEAGAPGVLARIDDGDGRWVGTSGVADLATDAPVPGDARFRVASLTKSVVATIVLQLVQEKKLSLDLPIETWLPGIVADDDRITVRQLLNHTSGLSDYIDHTEFSDPTVYGTRTYRPERLLQYAEESGPAGEPGERFHYSNAGYILLGLLVEKVTGNRLGAEIHKRVLKPTGMTRSYFPSTDPEIHGPHATGYYLPEGTDPGSQGALKAITELNPSFAWAAYGLVSDARDMNRFYRHLFRGHLVDKALLRQMRDGVTTPQAPVFPHYGLGLESLALTCGEKWGATGSIPGYLTFAFADESGARRMTLSINVQRNDPGVGPMLLAGVDAFNRYFCGTPYQLPITK
ncbi:serine hydrolase domain-containing protein [Streptosporangium sp. KLBMP 9127]|nr:beta-lactamase family protein [Streptosporangium sp. KLBMP 9127]